MSFKRSIKHKEVLVDREAGESYITVTLYSRNRRDYPTRITESELKEIAIEGGAEMIEVISGPQVISNRYGEVTGEWTVKIPANLEPEGSTTEVLKKRTRRKSRATTKKEEE